MSRYGERGMSTSIQWALLMPLVLMIVFAIIQIGLWAHGRTVAANAATAAAEEAALLSAGPGAVDLGLRIASDGGLVDVAVRIGGSTEEVTASVSGKMPTFIDVGQTRVVEQVSRPKERVTVP